MGFKNLTVSVDETIIKEIKKLSFESEITQKELINRILKDGIDREKNK